MLIYDLRQHRCKYYQYSKIPMAVFQNLYLPEIIDENIERGMTELTIIFCQVKMLLQSISETILIITFCRINYDLFNVDFLKCMLTICVGKNRVFVITYSY